MGLDTIKWAQIDPTKLPPAVAASGEPIVRFFSYHDAHPVAIVMVLLEAYGVEWIEWEPEVLREEIVKTFDATSVSENNWQKIQAVRTLMTTVGHWKEWQIFEKILQALNNNIPRFDMVQRCTVAQLMAGIDIAQQIRSESYEDEVRRYVAACAIDQGVFYLPPPLDFAQEVLSQPMYRCKVCGNVDTDDLDGRCDLCVGRFTDKHPLNFKPSPAVDKDTGTNVTRYLLRGDPSPIKDRFDHVLKTGIDNVIMSDEKTEDVQALKLVVAYEYMRLRRRQLVEQLEELKDWVSS
jgi:rubrerythrin